MSTAPPPEQAGGIRPGCEIWSHRGNGLGLAENTLPAFRRLTELPVDGVELDVQRTRDGVLVVTHDEKLKRVSGDLRTVGEVSFAEIRTLNAAAYLPHLQPEIIPTLEEVLDVLGPSRLTINLELKNSVVRYPGMEEQVLELVARKGLEDRMLYSSFNHQSIAELRSLGSPSRLALLFKFRGVALERAARGKGVAAVHPFHQTLRSRREVRQCHDAGLRVNLWTVTRPQDLRRCSALGVDALITNNVLLALGMRDGRVPGLEQ